MPVVYKKYINQCLVLKLSSNIYGFLNYLLLLDEDECETNTDSCTENQYCVNTDGSHECKGLSHFSLLLYHTNDVIISRTVPTI